MASQAQLDMLTKVKTQNGFIAALDQSGGSTPMAKLLCGITKGQYSGDEEMFTKMHEMSTRIVASKAFYGDKILGAILFENTLDRKIAGLSSSFYLCQIKHVVPFLKVDKRLENDKGGVQLIKPIPGLDNLLDKAVAKEVFGTKMRSVIKLANKDGVHALVSQKFEVAGQILAKGLKPIIEHEIDINSPEKGAAELELRGELFKLLGTILKSQQVILKQSLSKVVAVSVGYCREKQTIYFRKKRMIPSFSRALDIGLFVLL